MPTEIRAHRSIERRALTDSEKESGYIGALRGVIPYDSDSHRLNKRGRSKQFIERIAPGAFSRSLSDGEIMVMAGHTDDPLMGLARNGKNLKITSDERSLTWEALVPDTRAGKDLCHLVDMGIINGTSFEFDVDGPDGEQWDSRDARTDTRIVKRANLRALNPVTWPAYAAGELMVELRRKDGGGIEFEAPAEVPSEPVTAVASEPTFDADAEARARRFKRLSLGLSAQ